MDLGMSPPCEAYVAPQDLDGPETTWPLHVRTCTECLLVQLPAYVDPADVFSHYAYFSSYSTSWVEHARRFAERETADLDLGAGSLVVEVASNDGYLLQHFVDRGVPVLGIEPAANVAQAARARGVRTEVQFLGAASGQRLRADHGAADLVVGNNVLAHVPDLRDFVAGLRALVADDGAVSLEFPHLARLIEQRQFDTVYHEHYSYLSLLTAGRALATAGLTVVDVEELATHGGSLRVRARPGDHAPSPAVEALLAEEAELGLHEVAGHRGFAAAVQEVKRDVLRFLLDAQDKGERVVGYGAPGKGNTFLVHCGIGPDLLPWTVDRNPFKHGMHLPGSRIPVLPTEALEDPAADPPDYVLVLPWNLRAEIGEQLAPLRARGTRLVTAIPRLEIW